MESCKKLDFRGRDVSTKIPNHFNLVSDNLALGLQLLSFSPFLFSVAESEPVRDFFHVSGNIIYTHMNANLAWQIKVICSFPVFPR